MALWPPNVWDCLRYGVQPKFLRPLRYGRERRQPEVHSVWKSLHRASFAAKQWDRDGGARLEMMGFAYMATLYPEIYLFEDLLAFVLRCTLEGKDGKL